MPWFRVDDTLANHPKARAAGLAAMGLWVVSGAYASQYLTGGTAPLWYVASWPGGKRYADQLVRAGLWEPDGAGWLFHEWDQRQPAKEQVEADRERTRQRQRRWRDTKRTNAVSNAVTGTVTGSVTNGVTNGTPALPGPTHLSSVVKEPSPSQRANEPMRIEILRRALETFYRKPYPIDQAQRTADLITAGRADIGDPVQYVLAAVKKEPHRYKPADPPATETVAPRRPLTDTEIRDRDEAAAAAKRALLEARTR